jgi:hypothetical protein
MDHVFISYARKDITVVDRLVKQLRKAKIPVWMDRSDLEVARQWPQQITDAIQSCKCFLLVISNNSVASPNVLRELNLAHEANLIIIPVMIERTVLPSSWKLQLAGIQYLEVDPARLSSLDGLVQVVERCRGQKKRKNQPTPTLEFTEDDRKTLVELLVKTDISTPHARISLCYRIGIAPNELSFLTGTSTNEFATMLVHQLMETGRNENLAALCDELIGRLGSQYHTRLKEIHSKLTG